MTRHDPSSSAGWVNWPAADDPKYRSSGEGGLAAYAIWTATRPSDALVCAADLSVAVSLEDVFVGAIGPGAERFSAWREWHAAYKLSHRARAVTLLGSTGGTPVDDVAEKYFTVEHDHLTEEGKAVLAALSRLHGAEPVIVTILDT